MGFFTTFAGSFYCPRVYAQARQTPRSMMLIYTLLVVMITSAVLTIAGAAFLNHLLLHSHDGEASLSERVLLDLARQVPVMTLKDGTLTVKARQPYVIDLAMAGKRYPFIEIDTTGNTNMHNKTAPVLVTAREIYVSSKKSKEGVEETKVYTLESFAKNQKTPLIINRALAEDTTKRTIRWVQDHFWQIALGVGIPVWLGVTFVVYILRVFMLLVLGLVGLVMAEFIKPRLEYPMAVQIAAVAYTPVAVLETVHLCLTGNALSTLALGALGVLMTCVGVYVSRGAGEGSTAC